MRGLKKGRECLESIGGDDTINKQQEWLYRCLTCEQNSRVSIAGICYLNLNPTYFDINRDRMGTLNVVQAEFHRPDGCMPGIPSTSLENVPNVCIGDRERTAIMASLMTMRLQLDKYNVISLVDPERKRSGQRC